MSNYQYRLQELVAQVAAAYLSHTHVAPEDIPQVIHQVWRSLEYGPPAAKPAPQPAEERREAAEPPKPTSAQIRRSITPDVLVSFENGRAYKTLKRHLTSRGLTPELYRAKWGLPPDYPMVAANYSAVRAETARRTKLGQLGSRARALQATHQQRRDSGRS